MKIRELIIQNNSSIALMLATNALQRKGKRR
jgi:hypothetical protein